MFVGGRPRSNCVVRGQAGASIARGGRRTKRFAPFLLTLVVPVGIAAAFPHPSDRLIAAFSLMFTFAVTMAVMDGHATGLVAVVAGGLSLWYFNTAYAFSFRVQRPHDAEVLALTGLTGIGGVVLVSFLSRYNQRVVWRRTEQAVGLVERTLLPVRVPTVDGLRVGWTSGSGGDADAPAGGDFLVFRPCGPTAIGVGLGDVTGHGLDAANSMGAYRYGLADAAYDRCDPNVAMERLEGTAAVYSDGTLASCLHGIVDIDEASFTYTAAGHPPPILIRDSQAIVLDAAHGPLIGAPRTPGTTYGQTITDLRDGDLLAFYSDGLVERRCEPIETGIARLGTEVRNVDPEDFSGAADQIVTALVGDHPPDDTSLVLIHVTLPAATPTEAIPHIVPVAVPTGA